MGKAPKKEGVRGLGEVKIEKGPLIRWQLAQRFFFGQFCEIFTFGNSRLEFFNIIFSEVTGAKCKIVNIKMAINVELGYK